VGPDGATHQAIEDIALVRVIPNMTVIVPADALEAKKATIVAADIHGPVYLRFAREKTPVFTTNGTPFEVGKAEILWQSDNPSASSGQRKPDVAIIGCGPLLHNAILAAAELEKEGIGVVVVNNHTIKPMDERTVVKVAKEAGAVVTVEEHNVQGGMGSAVAEILAKNHPVPIEFIGVQNRFGESGAPAELIEHFGMGITHIVQAVKKVIERK